MNKGAWYVLIFLLCLFGCKKDSPREIETITSRPTQPYVYPVGLFDTAIHGYWVGAPNIRICPGSGISHDRVREALSFWDRAGYPFGRIIEPRADGTPCSAQIGEIAFRIPTQEEISLAVSDGLLGVAKTQIDQHTGEIMRSNIYFQTQIASHKPKIVEHEVGHALGWKHHARKYHIMHPNFSDMGLSCIGMEISRYNERRSHFQSPLSETNE